MLLGERVSAVMNSMRFCWVFCSLMIASCAVCTGDVVCIERRFEFDLGGLGATFVVTGGGGPGFGCSWLAVVAGVVVLPLFCVCLRPRDDARLAERPELGALGLGILGWRRGGGFGGGGRSSSSSCEDS